MIFLAIKVFLIVMFIVWLLLGRQGVYMMFGGMRKRRDRMRAKVFNWLEGGDK